MLKPNFRFQDLHPELPEWRDEVVRGLSAVCKRLPSYLLYDEIGSRLFDAICDTEEYYLTRTEIGILERAAAELAARLGPSCAIVEYGCGSARKIRPLLDELEGPLWYIPVDISGEHLARGAEALAEQYPHVNVLAVCADYRKLVSLPLPASRARRRVVFFPGSSIGNYDPEGAVDLLQQARHLVGPGGALVVGVDRPKPEPVLVAAYNDRRGLTARFERNVLRRLNREMGADFALDRFDYEGLWDAENERVEMYLFSRGRQEAHVAGRRIGFGDGEAIHVEDSYKYTPARFRELAERAGLVASAHWTDAREWFSVHLLEAPPVPAWEPSRRL